jgi:hypothetical protein
MKNISVILLFVLSLLSLGMALELKEVVQPPRLAAEAGAPKHAVDAGSTRGRPGEDDSDEEDEEDLRGGVRL